MDFGPFSVFLFAFDHKLQYNIRKMFRESNFLFLKLLERAGQALRDSGKDIDDKLAATNVAARLRTYQPGWWSQTHARLVNF